MLVLGGRIEIDAGGDPGSFRRTSCSACTRRPARGSLCTGPRGWRGWSCRRPAATPSSPGNRGPPGRWSV